MPVAVTDLLRFILQLLGDPAKAEEFNSDPSGILASAGLGDLSCAEVDAITPLVANAAPGAVAISHAGGVGQPEPAEMIQNLVKSVAVSNYDNSGIIQNIWGADEVTQAFASEGGLAFGGDLLGEDPVVIGDGNVVATDTAQASGRDTIQNQADGNLALGGDQTIAQDDGVIAGNDNIAQGDKVGGNNNTAENTGNDNSVSVGGNQNNAENTGNDNSVSVGGNQHNAENTGNTTNHDQSFSVGDVSIDNSDNSDNSTTVGGNQNNAENTGNATYHDESFTVGDVTVDASDDHSVGGDYWEGGSNVGGIGNTDNRNSGNTSDSGNTVAYTEANDSSTNVGTVAIDMSTQEDNSSTTGDVDNSTHTDNSIAVGDVSLDTSDNSDNSVTSGDVDNSTQTDNSSTSGDVDNSVQDDHSLTTGDTVDYDYNYTLDDHSVGGDYYEQGSGNSVATEESHTSVVENDFDYTWGE